MRTWVTTFGATSMTVTGTSLPFSSQTWVMPSFVPSRPLETLELISAMSTSELDLDVDVSREVETHQRVDGLGRRVDDVDEALVGAHLEVLAAVLVLVGRPDDAHDVLLGRKGHRAHDRRARTGHGVDDFARRRVDDLVVIRLQANADLLSRHCLLTLFLASYLWGIGRTGRLRAGHFPSRWRWMLHRCSDVNPQVTLRYPLPRTHTCDPVSGWGFGLVF
ncbi:conserved hypothetical protein [uncultured Microbacterium sp.]|uniref:Uncharacterized protein n=1 Tax=uncultured Microbacterium sp. TaxID=191216 RepID=A0A1Y5P401_9MICO|nr:conserved hypothetical protein [uncultured Microbacterium sp.]